MRVKFDCHCLNQEVIFPHGAVLNFHILYEINLWLLDHDSKFVLLTSFFGAAKVNKNLDLDKYSYTGYGIRFGKM